MFVFRVRKLFVNILSNYTNKMTICKVAVCQFTATNDKVNNLRIVTKLIKAAAEDKAKVIFLPEACDYIATNEDECRNLAETIEGSLCQAYKSLAKNLNVYLSIGGFHELKSDSKIYNSHILINDQGNIQSIYRKLHLFNVSIPEMGIALSESKTTCGGEEIVTPTQTPAGLLSLSICYDLRFPELSLMLRKQGADILTYPSAFTYSTGEMHWKLLLRARAVENQCYVIAAAQYGKHNDKRISYGRSMIVDPWGKILVECPKYYVNMDTNESIGVAEINLDVIRKARREMPVFEHRRNDLYILKCTEGKLLGIDDQENFAFADKTILGSTVFYKTKHSYAFTNIRCVVPGHVLISSQRCAPRLADLSQEEVADLFVTAVKVQKVMEEVHSSNSSTICVQDGQLAGQTVPHVHVHILPRKKGDFERNDDIYTELARHDRDENSAPLRDVKEMIAEALYLRQFFI